MNVFTRYMLWYSYAHAPVFIARLDGNLFANEMSGAGSAMASETIMKWLWPVKVVRVNSWLHPGALPSLVPS